MDKNFNLVIIGGSAAGPTAASTARRKNPDVRIIMVEQGEYISYGA